VVTGAAGPGVLHAGTRRRHDGAIVSTGGRVLSVLGTGVDLAAARKQAYQRVEQVHLPGGHYRRDIGLRATRREDGLSAGV
jgi:phosphoribosylamine--glycine ligase